VANAIAPEHLELMCDGAEDLLPLVRHIHDVTLDEAALARVAPHVAALAEAEGLAAHAESVVVRGAAAPRTV
ncbi:MAG TPA: hypothetical protein VHF00_00670, partial [Acidimicrobiales bacterium]|nr:hypothetical protein [Acidimicrobiales bacterium]